MKKCSECGSDNSSNSKFCQKCGNELSESKNSNSIFKVIAIITLVIVIIAGASLAYIIYFDVSPVEISYLNQKDSGNIYNNPALASNIPDSDNVGQMINLAGSGIPVFKIGDGTPPVTLIVAGVHGDQLSSQVASMQIIDYLSGRKISGTVYVIPFASPSAVAANTKLSNGINLNTVADEPGTISNDILNFAKINNVSALGDFHGTEPGKNPGKTTIMCSQAPCYESYLLATEMNSYINQDTMTYMVAGISYDGAIEDEANIQGIPSVTPLVLSNHGQVNDVSVQESLLQMLAILHANGNLNDDSYNKLANADIDGF
ncbi:zinc-ribbon domain-containing protein [Methanobrevibacter sp. DSM 116169]|uniref:zinc-ribbon domain-containing protein n=1 Tax=Methanobrevibacter sp. DSM 116169 TaxID=3242727 RepID=UPI0038FC76A4